MLRLTHQALPSPFVLAPQPIEVVDDTEVGSWPLTSGNDDVGLTCPFEQLPPDPVGVKASCSCLSTRRSPAPFYGSGRRVWRSIEDVLPADLVAGGTRSHVGSSR